MLHQALPYLAVTGGTAISLAASASDPSSNVAPYVGGGAGVVAVMALGEVTRRLLNGRLIPRETAETEAELGAYIVAAGQREDRAMRAAEEANALVKNSTSDLKQHQAKVAFELAEVTERQSKALLAEMAALTRAVEDLRDEVRARRREGPR